MIALCSVGLIMPSTVIAAELLSLVILLQRLRAQRGALAHLYIARPGVTKEPSIDGVTDDWLCDYSNDLTREFDSIGFVIALFANVGVMFTPHGVLPRVTVQRLHQLAFHSTLLSCPSKIVSLLLPFTVHHSISHPGVSVPTMAPGSSISSCNASTPMDELAHQAP